MFLFSEPKTTISINKARKLLGSIGESMSDKEVIDLVIQLEVLATTVIEAFIVQKASS